MAATSQGQHQSHHGRALMMSLLLPLLGADTAPTLLVLGMRTSRTDSQQTKTTVLPFTPEQLESA